MSAKEMLKILSKQWCSVDDLKKISNLGHNKVYALRKEIVNELVEQGYTLPKGLIPMCEVVKKLKIDVEYLKSISNL